MGKEEEGMGRKDGGSASHLPVPSNYIHASSFFSFTLKFVSRTLFPKLLLKPDHMT